MKKYSLYSTAICMLLVGFFLAACEKEKIGISSQDSNLALQTKQDTTDLASTKWKLIGFVSNQNQKSTMIEAEPKCDRCYTLVFDTDSTASGYVYFNDLIVSLNPVSMVVTTKVGDEHNGTVKLFYESIKSVNSYQIKNDTLKFFYNNNDNYLLFKLIEQ